ncbi:TPA: hypothetical protein L3F32_004034 [Citrobacter freundii]|nr:hypothetical protein [Citrobacter freundii]
MKIDFNDYGAVASVTITSTIFEFRKHNRVVDTTLFLVPGVVSERRGSRYDLTRDCDGFYCREVVKRMFDVWRHCRGLDLV